MLSAEDEITIAFTLVQSIVFIVGFYLQIRTFLVAQSEQDLTWRLYMSHGVVLLIYHPSCIFMKASAQFLYPLSDFTGVWFCHVSSCLKFIGLVEMYSFSLTTAISKYIFIVHRHQVDECGKAKVQELIFWITLSLRILFAVSLLTNPNGLEIGGLVEYSACFGTSKAGMQVDIADHFLCGFERMPPNAPYGPFLDGITECFCILQSLIMLSVISNLPEAFLYYKIFRSIHRYTKLLPNYLLISCVKC